MTDKMTDHMRDKASVSPRISRRNAWRDAAISAISATAMIGGVANASTAMAASAPIPASSASVLESYKNWIIGCDNINHCTAASLFSEEEGYPDDLATLYIARDAGPDGALSLRIMLSNSDKGTADLLVDGVKHSSASISENIATVDGAGVDKLLRAMVRGKALTIWVKGRNRGSISLSGISAALRYMDARQGRAGTVTALVATGKLGKQSVRAAPATPVIHQMPPVKTDKASSRLWQGELGQVLEISKCADEQIAGGTTEITRLSEKEELVLVPCGNGAYNFNYVPLVATGMPGRRAFHIPRFDHAPGWSEEGATPSLVNASWDEDTGTLSSYAKGRGIGDCGSMESYVWDGSVFRMVEKRAMNECRGAWDWIRLWTAKTAPIGKDKKK